MYNTSFQGIPALIEHFNFCKEHEIPLTFMYGTITRHINNITNEGIFLENDINGLSHDKFVPYNYLLDDWGEIWAIYANTKGIGEYDDDIMFNFSFTPEEKENIIKMDTPADLAHSDFEDVTTDDEREMLEHRNSLSESYINRLKTLAGIKTLNEQMNILYYEHWFLGLPIEEKAIVVGIEPVGAVQFLRKQVDSLWNQMSDEEKIASFKNAQNNPKFIAQTKETIKTSDLGGHGNEKNNW